MSDPVTSQFVVAGLAVAATLFIHALMIIVLRGVAAVGSGGHGFGSDVIDVIKLAIVGLGLIVAHTASVMVWASVFLATEVSLTWEGGLYFALTTYTTLGFGDVLAPQPWRLLPGFASLNGLLLFGLSAAVLVDAAARLRRRHN
ncbi:MAG: potassium channel family protein [Pseudomonadota bacterium]